jgi:plastocyanin
VIAALAVAAAFAAPATHTVQAVSTATDNVWTPPTLSAKPGDTVVFNLKDPQNPSVPHDIWLKAPSESELTQRAASYLGAESWSTPANEIGTYQFKCDVHRDSMVGSFVVAEEDAPPPPPPVDTGPAAAPNPEPAPTVLEEGDNVRPTMGVGRVSVRGTTARVRVISSEAGTLYLRVLRGRKALTTKRVKVGPGTTNASVKLPRRRGSYRLAVWVRDTAGLESKWRYERLRVRR